jgi:hypothetical protein
LRTLALALSLVALITVGCGGNGEEGEAEQKGAATPAEAVEEVGQVRKLLAEGLAAYRDGDADRAETLVGDAYLEHFEHVEHPLEERDPELMEELEVLISTTIRNAIKGGAAVGEVERLVEDANAKLNTAERLLAEEA